MSGEGNQNEVRLPVAWRFAQQAAGTDSQRRSAVARGTAAALDGNESSHLEFGSGCLGKGVPIADRIPNWFFRVDERSAGAWQAEGIDLWPSRRKPRL
jgi:hypothetical protein